MSKEQLGLNFAVERRIYRVAELNEEVRALLEGHFDHIQVAGEISNCRRAPSGHYYFTLKDDRAQLRCVCFRQHAMYLKVKPVDGLAVVARGSVSVYEARGEYQLYVEHIEPQGHGALQLAFEQLKSKLAAEGLFDDDRKRALPMVPRRIGIVTSPTGAAIADMLRILARRFPGIAVRIFPVRVQGDGAAAEIVKGLDYFSESGGVDVVITGRGGGSIEDLWAFNEEIVARAIARSTVPVVSAVGHQTDFTIADFVADLRAPTPSAAAELVAPLKSDLLETLHRLEGRAAQSMRYRISRIGRRLLEAGVSRGATVVRRKIARYWQRNDDLTFRHRQAMTAGLRRAERELAERQKRLAALDIEVRLARFRSKLELAGQRLAPPVNRALEQGRARLDSLSKELEALSPLGILERGYSIVQLESGEVVRQTAQVPTGALLNIKLHRGRVSAKVLSAEPVE